MTAGKESKLISLEDVQMVPSGLTYWNPATITTNLLHSIRPMVIPLEHPQRIILLKIQFFVALLLVVHQRDTRETRRDDAQWENRCL